MNIRPAILIIENDKILTMQYRYGEQDVYSLPGGNLEFGEMMAHALKREMQEELEIEVSVGELLMVGEIHFSEQKKHSLHCIFQGKIMVGTPVLNPLHTSAKAIKWLAINDLQQENLYPNIGKEIALLIEGKLDNKYLGKINQPWF